jgi:hypothetical protein
VRYATPQPSSQHLVHSSPAGHWVRRSTGRPAGGAARARLGAAGTGRGSSILVDNTQRHGLWLLVVFLVPVTVIMPNASRTRDGHRASC